MDEQTLLNLMKIKEIENYGFDETYVIEKDDNKFIFVVPCFNIGFYYFEIFFIKI